MKGIFLKSLAIVVVSLALSFGSAYAGPAAALRPTISVSSPIVVLDKNAKLIIMGSGYRPGQEVVVLFHDAFGVLTNVPENAVANDRGSWAMVWDMNDYVSKNIITGGVYAIMAADAKYNVFASTAVGFIDASKDPKDWPDWAKAADVKKPEVKPKESGKQKDEKKKEEKKKKE